MIFVKFVTDFSDIMSIEDAILPFGISKGMLQPGST